MSNGYELGDCYIVDYKGVGAKKILDTIPKLN
jgi:hypothetical protein